MTRRRIAGNTEREIRVTNIIVDELKPNLSADVPLDAFLRRASRIVEDEFGEKGEIPPSWFLVTASGQTHAVVMPFFGAAADPFADNAKHKGVAFMRDYFKKCDVVRYAHVAEAWMGTELASVRASMDPNRIEIVSLIVEDRDGACCGTREIIRPVPVATECVRGSAHGVGLLHAADGRRRRAHAQGHPRSPARRGR